MKKLSKKKTSAICISPFFVVDKPKRQRKPKQIGFMRYPHIPILTSMKPTPRILLGQKLFWTEKKDGSNMALWMKNKEPHLSSRNLENASKDLEALTKRSEDYPKLLDLLKENPQFIIYFEACRKGRSVTGIEVYNRDTLIIFDIYDTSSEKFLPYVLVYQHSYHHGIPVVKLWAETRHRTMKDLLKFKNHALEYCIALNLEGMVIKSYTIPESFKKYLEYYKELNKGLIQAKVKQDLPEPLVRKIAKGKPVYPTIPENEVMNCIDKAWQDLGTEKFKDVKLAMPLIAKYVSDACKQHLFSNSNKKLFIFYQEYIERMINHNVK